VATVRVGDFEWNEEKAEANLAKHGISFQEAMTVFLDELSVPLAEIAHPERLVLIGEFRLGRVLLVVFTIPRSSRTSAAPKPSTLRSRRSSTRPVR